MLKNRQDGLVALHGAILLILIAAMFLGSLMLVESQDWIQVNPDFNWGLYLVGVLGAMAWIHRAAAELKRCSYQPCHC